MLISCDLENSAAAHRISVSTNDNAKELSIGLKQEGRGSAINGGELLVAALATCYCNDIYREAAQLNISVRTVRIQVKSEFGAAGAPASSIEFRAEVDADASPEQIQELLHITNSRAEVQNTLRQGIDVKLVF